jgi:hypothetical protein
VGVSRRRWRTAVAVAALAVFASVVALLSLAGQWFLAVTFAVYGLTVARMLRGWPWLAAWQFRREIDRYRNDCTRFIPPYPFTAPVERRRAVRREPQMREADRDER